MSPSVEGRKYLPPTSYLLPPTSYLLPPTSYLMIGTSPPVQPFKKALTLTPNWSSDRTVNLGFDDRFAPIRVVATNNGGQSFLTSGIVGNSSNAIVAFEPKDTPVIAIKLNGNSTAFPYTVDLNEIAALERVEEIDFGILRFSESIDILASLPKLKIIGTGYANNLFDANATAKMANWKSLEEIYARADTVKWYLDELTHLPLKILELEASFIDRYQGLEQLSSLKRICFAYTKQRTTIPCNLSHFYNLVNLETLELINANATGSLIHLADCNDLYWINLTDNINVNDGLEVVQFLPKLNNLNVDRCSFSQTQLDALVAILVDLGDFFIGAGKTLNVAAQKTGETFSAGGLSDVDILVDNYGWNVIY